MSDVHFSAQNKGWDSLAVVEELATFDRQLDGGIDPCAVDTSEKWGAYFVHECGRRNFFVGEIAKVARYALPYVRNIGMMIR